MQRLVIYDSQFGNTKKIATAIAQDIHSEAVHVKDVTKEMLKGISLVIVGSPIQGWRPTQRISDFLESLPARSLEGVNAAAFDTRVKLFIHGDAAGKISNLLKKAGAKMLAKPQGFVVKGKEGPLEAGELWKARLWAEQILDDTESLRLERNRQWYE